MSISQKQPILETIAARASTPPERLQLGFETDEDLSSRVVKNRLQRLHTFTEAISNEAFNSFLVHQGIDRQQLAHALSPSHLPQNFQQPAWLKTLNTIVMKFHSTAGFQTLGQDHCQEAKHPQPFEEFFLPFLRFARQQLNASITYQQSMLLSDRSFIDLEKYLLQEMTSLAGQALQLEFSIFRVQRRLGGGHQSRRLYDAFLAQYEGEGMLSFFLEYSVLARLLVLTVEHWIDACKEFLQRLEDDQESIAKFFQAGSPTESVVAISPGLSDAHHGGRTVFLLTFASGFKLVYKPRCLDTDQAFFDLLSWINSSGFTSEVRAVRVLSRETHGWAEYIEHLPCQTLEEVQRYYQHAGVLLCLLYILHGSDMHYENVFANRDCPMIVDMETIITTDLSSLLNPRDSKAHWIHTVMKSGFLPNWKKLNDGPAIDVSGLGYATQKNSNMLYRRWKYINTDAMEICQEHESPESTKIMPSLVLLQETSAQLSQYAEDVVTGFRSMYRFLIEYQDTLLTSEGPLASFWKCNIRFVIRSTLLYKQHLIRLTHPSFLRDGADRWIEQVCFEIALPESENVEQLWPITEAEVRALEQLDVPWFGTKTDSHDLIANDGVVIKNALYLSAVELVQSTVSQLNEPDLERQINFIRTALLIPPSLHLISGESSITHLAGGESSITSLEGEDMLTAAELIEVACGIAQNLKKCVFHSPDGKHLAWIGPIYDTVLQHYRMQILDEDMYQGTSGIALFLAALAQMTGESEWYDLARKTLQPSHKHVKNGGAALESGYVGAALGSGSCIYALCRVSQWLNLPEFLNDAQRIALLITQDAISADQYNDVIGGTAGAILGLVALYRITGDKDVLQRAVFCGQHLLDQRIGMPGTRSWNNKINAIPLTGFSHGAAGIAYALLLLFEISGQQEFQRAAEEAIAFELQFFLPEVGNWSDLRENPGLQKKQACMTSWCNGAPGIGLARLGGLPQLDTPQVRDDLEIALVTTLKYALSSLDNLCCGNFGRIELLVATSQKLTRPYLLEEARRRATILVHNATQQGGFYSMSHLPRLVSTLGLFQGIAGIGYELLRLAAPDKIPSVLLWE